MGKKPKNHGDVGQGSPSNDAYAWETCPQSEPCSPTTMVVDKSKNRTGEKTQGVASATTTQGADTEEQHYECSTVFGQDWLGNENLESNHRDVGQESLSKDANETVPQPEPHNPGAVYAVVDKGKKGNKGKKNSDSV